MDVFVGAVDAVNSEQVVRVVECVEAPMLSDHCNHSGTSPVEAFAEQLPIDSETYEYVEQAEASENYCFVLLINSGAHRPK